MNIYGVIGWKNAGKTSLMERLVAEISGRGLRVSTVKHVHHDVDLDQPGKDTYRHRTAGAEEVVLASANRMALLREHRGGEPDLAVILARMAPVDLVLVEGYKRDTHPKIEVYRREAGHVAMKDRAPAEVPERDRDEEQDVERVAEAGGRPLAEQVGGQRREAAAGLDHADAGPVGRSGGSPDRGPLCPERRMRIRLRTYGMKLGP